MKLFFNYICMFYSVLVLGQTYSAIIVDTDTKLPLESVNIIWAVGKGTTTNASGKFYLPISEIKNKVQFSYIGYQNFSISLQKNKPDSIFMSKKSTALDEVLIQKKQILTANQIIDSVNFYISKNYNFDNVDRYFFLKQTDEGSMDQLDVTLKKSTIKEFDDDFIKKTLDEMPKDNSFLNEILGHQYGGLKNQKLIIEKAHKAYDLEGEGYLEKYYLNLENTLNKYVKSDSYFKIRTGILSFKMDAQDGFIKDGEVVDIRNDMGSKKKQTNFFLNDRKNILKGIYKDIFLKSSSKINILKNPSSYNLEYQKEVTITDIPVYQIYFNPKSNRKYKGILYVNTKDFAVIRMDYENTEAIRSIKLFGLSFKEIGHKGTIIFTKNSGIYSSGKYDIKYIQKQNKVQFGIDRSFSIIEKNKNVKGRRKQNKMSFNMLMKGGFGSNYEYFVFNQKPLSNSPIDESLSQQPKHWKRQQGSFWGKHPEVQHLPSTITTLKKIKN